MLILGEKLIKFVFIYQNGFENYLQWEEQYGKTFGYYEGPRPIIVTSDPDFIREVFVKKFSNFHGRKVRLMYKIVPLSLIAISENIPWDIQMVATKQYLTYRSSFLM